MKPHIRLAYTLMLAGLGLIALERFGLAQLATPGQHLDPNLISALAIAPLALIGMGGLVYVFGRFTTRR
ncbi:hypothetical protein EMQ25_03235 [Arsenicitalea aurantiaca]|uniref:Uncharacterized protein n=1 Tax=Arsenicitalea aurantiaca TaxID=1783274 RepID=A0A433XLL9_9HYPH|nr:hypothetical protein [Arsenicitalea aurantiaca]RUT34982.1 hypothetical protein EMQ25_03235 [Arsenicitalea aurantiaca]